MNRTRSRVLAFAFCAASLIFTGCYSDSPLDSSPEVPLDSALLGSWRCVSAEPDADNAASLVFSAAPGKEREYHITWQEPGKEADVYRAFVSSVRGATFMNVRPLEESTYAGWAFFRYSSLSSRVLYAEFVPEKPFKEKQSSASAAAARATLEAALQTMTNPLQEFCVCLRVAEGQDKQDKKE